MNRKLATFVAALGLLGLGATAHAQPKKSLTYKVSLGGMNAGSFTQMTIPTHAVTLAGDDVIVQAKTNGVDARPIKLTGGTVSAFTSRVLKPKVGEQMTVQIAVVPVGAAPGKRCAFTLGHAFLKGVNGVSLTLRPSSLPKVKCTGDKPAPSAP